MCQSYEPQPEQPIPDSIYDDNFTEDFNYQLEVKGIPYKVVYGQLGDIQDPDHETIRTRDCEAVDCLNPCYEDGSCYYCADHLT